jgi:hypothetical protein
MFARPNKKYVKRLAPAVIVLAMAGLFLAQGAFARILTNTIDSDAIVTHHGRHLVVTGPLQCTAGEQAFLRVTVTQRPTGAVAEGGTLISCTGDLQHWEVRAATQGKARFQEGAAIATAIATTHDQGNTTDAHQWLVAITLVGE